MNVGDLYSEKINHGFLEAVKFLVSDRFPNVSYFEARRVDLITYLRKI